MPRFVTHTHRPDAVRDEVLEALLHTDRAHHDELGRTEQEAVMRDSSYESSPREQAAAPIDLQNVDE